MEWRTSSYSKDWNQALCVEVADSEGAWFVRDSKNPTGSVLALTDAGWSEFVGWLKDKGSE